LFSSQRQAEVRIKDPTFISNETYTRLTGWSDTLWASGYDIYDSLSEPYQGFLEGLTATFEQPGFQQVAERSGFKLYDKQRGAPENIGSALKAIHPVVRTNPVTGWKSIFPVGGHVKHINGLAEDESKKLLDWFLELVYKNHDLQVRLKWKNPNDLGEFNVSSSTAPSSLLILTGTTYLAIWDNRSVFHTATFDYNDQGNRFGNRAVGIGERPFFDPKSTSRRTALSA
jgi:alpha-ketoglutarate-dependent taurine dioxygenase